VFYVAHVLVDATTPNLEAPYFTSCRAVTISRETPERVHLSDVQLKSLANMIVAEPRWVQTGGGYGK